MSKRGLSAIAAMSLLVAGPAFADADLKQAGSLTKIAFVCAMPFPLHTLAQDAQDGASLADRDASAQQFMRTGACFPFEADARMVAPKSTLYAVDFHEGQGVEPVQVWLVQPLGMTGFAYAAIRMLAPTDGDDA